MHCLSKTERRLYLEDGLPNGNGLSIVLLDDHSTMELPLSLFQRIQIITSQCKHFMEVEEAILYIKKAKENIIFAITNGKLLQDILDQCGDQPHLRAVYVIDSKANLIASRRVVYYSESRTFLKQIESDIQPLVQESLAFRFFDRNQKTMRNLNKESASFIWSQMLLGVLKKFPADHDAIEAMLSMLEEYYHHDQCKLKKLEEFRRKYDSTEAIEWYTTTLIHGPLNRALRTEDTDALYLFRGFIIDLCLQLKEERKKWPFQSSITAYHGQLMSEWELNQIKESISHIVSSNAFFSASIDEQVGKFFAGDNQPHLQLRNVLFKIEIPPDLRHTVATYIGNRSCFKDENEVLFSISSAFKILNVYEDPNAHLWHVCLQATDEGQQVVEDYKKLSELDVENPTIEILFGRLLIYMGQYTKAVQYFTSLSTRIDESNDINRIAILCNQSNCFYHMCEYVKAAKCLEECLTLFDPMQMSQSSILYLRCRFYLAKVFLFTNQLQKSRLIFDDTLIRQRLLLPSDHEHIADTLRAIGNLCGNESGYHRALPFRKEALKIYEKILPKNHPKRINALHDIAGCYEAVGQFKEALLYLHQALEISESCVLDNHSSYARILRSIGINEQNLGHWEQAFGYYCRAYSIWMSAFPKGHVFTAFCLNKMGEIYRIRKQFSEALDCQKTSLEMRTSLFPLGTPQPHHSLGLTYLDMGDIDTAIEHFRLGCFYWQAKTTDPGHMYLNFAESCLATAYSHHGEFEKAHRNFTRILILQEDVHPQGNPDIAITLHHMASNLVRMGEYHRAMECYQKSVDMFLKYFEKEHFEIVMIQEKMATLLYILENLTR